MHSKRASKLSRLYGLTLAAAAGSAITGQVAIAQDAAADSLEEVVVTTARQRTEALQDVPASITAITASTLEAASVDRAGDFIRLTPGVSLVQTAEVADAQVNIRGINGARDAENSFALIIDGILQTNPAAFNREYADLQQIEVVKGPQGAIYGRNAAAGAIIITTTKPGSDFGADVKLGYGEDSTQTGSVVASGPMSDRAGWKIAADYRKTDGFFYNKFLKNNTVDDFEGWNVNGRLVFEPTDSSTLDLKAHYGKVDAASISFNADFLVPGLVLSGLPNAPLFNEDVNTHKFDFVNNIDPTNDQEALDVSLKFDSELGHRQADRLGAVQRHPEFARFGRHQRVLRLLQCRCGLPGLGRAGLQFRLRAAAAADHLLRRADDGAGRDLRSVHAGHLRRHAVPGAQPEGLQLRGAPRVLG